MWASNNEGVGAWISIQFNGLFEILTFKYKDRKNPAERNSLLLLTFSNGETKDIQLKNTDEETSFDIDHIKATSVKITIKGVYGTMNNGGAFSFIGIRCKNGEDDDTDEEDEKSKNKLVPLFVRSSQKMITLNCRDSFSNTHKFDNINLKPNVKVSVKCPESCANSDVPVYGYLKYSKDTAICRSAFHAQKIGSRGGIVTIVFGRAMSNFKSKLSNGIKSEGKATSEFTVAFEAYEEEDVIIVKAGSKIDIFNLGRPMWLPGIITAVIDNSKGRFIKYIIEGRKLLLLLYLIILYFIESDPEAENQYPDLERINPCGKHLKDRNCKGSLKKMTDFKPIKFRFVPTDYQNPGIFVPDSGQTMEQSGKPFGKYLYQFILFSITYLIFNLNSIGWSKDMTKRMFLRANPSKPEIETHVEFPPSPISRFCNKPAPDSICETVTWSVLVGEGSYKVKVFAGDPQNDTRLDLTVNDKIIIRNKKIPKNTMLLHEEKLESKNGLLTFMSECHEDCNEAVSQISAIEIFPNDDNNEPIEEKTTEKEFPCGIAYKGGNI